MYNRAKGRLAEWAERVNANDPANAVFVIAVFDMGATTDATLRDLDTLQQVIDDVNSVERTTNGWTRKTLSDSGGVTIVYDDTNDRVDVDCPDQTWTAVAGAGGAATDVVVAYDSDSAAGTDTNVLPGTQHDFPITPDGSDVTAQVNVFFRAS